MLGMLHFFFPGHHPHHHKPCSHTDDLGARLGVLFNIDGPVGLLLPDGRLIISVNDIEFNINIGVERWGAAVGRANPKPVLGVLRGWMGDREREKKKERRGGRSKNGGSLRSFFLLLFLKCKGRSLVMKQEKQKW